MGTALIAAAGAASRRALEDLLYTFRAADATAPERAVRLTKLGVGTSEQLTMLQSAGVIKPGDRDSWYLDERALRGYQTQSRSRVRWILVVCALTALGLAVFTFFLARA
jgi:hypothetical protein